MIIFDKIRCTWHHQITSLSLILEAMADMNRKASETNTTTAGDNQPKSMPLADASQPQPPSENVTAPSSGALPPLPIMPPGIRPDMMRPPAMMPPGWILNIPEYMCLVEYTNLHNFT